MVTINFINFHHSLVLKDGHASLFLHMTLIMPTFEVAIYSLYNMVLLACSFRWCNPFCFVFPFYTLILMGWIFSTANQDPFNKWF